MSETVAPAAETAQPEVKCVISALFAFVIGKELNLKIIRELNVGKQEVPGFKYKTRTPDYLTLPPSISITIPLANGQIDLGEGIQVEKTLDYTFFKAGAVTVRFEIQFAGTLKGLREVSKRLQSSDHLRKQAEGHVRSMTDTVKAAIKHPMSVNDYEDYFIFDITAEEDADGIKYTQKNAQALAGILRGETAELAEDEVKEALAEQTGYFKEDRVVIGWTGALLYGKASADEALVIESAVEQLLLIRLLHADLEAAVSKTRELLETAEQGQFRDMRSLRTQLREAMSLQLDVKLAIDAVTNEFELVGDQYLARVYRLAVKAFAMRSWETQLREKAAIVNDAHQQLSGQAHHEQGHRLELIVIRLIVVEVIVGLIELGIGLCQLAGLLGGHH